jgi:outer membrane assembly lipoprotein YfgL
MTSARTLPRWAGAVAAAVAVLLAGCASDSLKMPSFAIFGGAEKPVPAQLQANPALLGVRQAWVTRIGEVPYALAPAVNGTTVTLASGDGAVMALEAASGRELWRASAGAPLAAGVGSDGNTTAVITRANDVVAFAGGKEIWRQRMPALSYTPPFVAGARVFVLAADRSVTAFDGRTGHKLWSQARPGEPLVLRQAGVLLAVGDTLVAGQGGRLAGLNPANGSVRWEAPIATPRGINDIERLADLVGSVSRIGTNVCARAFQAAVGCVDASRGTVVWAQRANGFEGIHGDAANVFGTESDGKVVSWKRDTGQRAWTNERLLYRGLSAPLSLGRSVVVGDATGFVHLLSREDGSLLNRLATDGSPIVSAPLVAGNTLVVVTRNGGVYGFVPE